MSVYEIERQLRRDEAKPGLADKADNGQTSQTSQISQTSHFATPLIKPELAPEALHGLAGEIVNSIDLYTEADRVAVLVTLLVFFGNVIGRYAHFKVEFTRHFLNLFGVLMGETSKGRKGQSQSTPRHMLRNVDREWVDKRMTGGLSSGEGLIHNVRDAMKKEKDGVVEIVDAGEADKRLMLIEEEFSQCLKVMAREGNILSAIIRQAWDSGNLHPLIKNNPIQSTNAHVSIIAHITKAELLKYLNETEQGNGFANRFLWLLVSRSKCIPNPQGAPDSILAPLIERLKRAVEFARTVGEMKRDQKAEAVWADVYEKLSDGKPGLLGAVISRAEAQTMRLACLFGLLDLSGVVRTEHLMAALALWDYCEKSAALIFGAKTGDNNVDRALSAIRVKGKMTLTELYDAFSKHIKRDELVRVVNFIRENGLARVEQEADGKSKPTTIIYAANCELSEVAKQGVEISGGANAN